MIRGQALRHIPAIVPVSELYGAHHASRSTASAGAFCEAYGCVCYIRPDLLAYNQSMSASNVQGFGEAISVDGLIGMQRKTSYVTLSLYLFTRVVGRRTIPRCTTALSNNTCAFSVASLCNVQRTGRGSQIDDGLSEIQCVEKRTQAVIAENGLRH